MTIAIKVKVIIKGKGMPEVTCPTCKRQFYGRALTAKIDQLDTCERCGQKMFLIADTMGS